MHASGIPIDDLTLVTCCPLCDSVESVMFEINGNMSNDICGVECTDCGLVYMNKVLRGDCLDTFYEGYSDNRDTSDVVMLENRQKMYRLDSKFISQRLDHKAPAVIDVGCGNGEFLSNYVVARQKIGIEVDSRARLAGMARNKQVDFYSDMASISSKKPNKVDAILFRGTLQYMENLHGVREFCLQHLNPNGMIFVLALPNRDSVLCEVARENWGLYNRLEHRNLFGLHQVLKMFGNNFELESFDFPYLGTPYENYSLDSLKLKKLLKTPSTGDGKFPYFGSMINIALRLSN
jgi:SAM-dependent methyltransferase